MVPKLVSSANEFHARINQWQQRHPWLAFMHAVLRKYLDDEAGHRAALLTYYAFLALFPLLLVLATILEVSLHRDTPFSQHVMQDAVNYIPAVGQELQANVHALNQSGVALLVGLAVALFGARGVADVLRGSLDHIWQVPYAKRRRLASAWLRSFAIVAVAGIGLAVTPVFFGYLLTFEPNRQAGILSGVFTAFVLFWVLILVIKLGTSTHQPLKRIWVGAMVALVSLGALQVLGSYIMAHQLRRLDALYGTFALVLGLIFWLYVQAQLLMMSFELDAVRYFKLWPRSLSRNELAPADHAAYKLYHERGRFHDKV
jgi:YihY family inner membrane protein